jgi:hypothetical protein
MSFRDQLRTELSRNGIRGALANRIIAELDDHLACDPEANVGEPSDIATRFAVELRIAHTRRASLMTFAALGWSAVLLAVAVVAEGRSGVSTWGSSVSALVMIACAQIALVAGILALVRGLRGRAVGDLRLAQRRSFVALAAGAGVSLSVAVNGVLLASMPTWWHVVAVVCGVASLPGLVAAAQSARTASAITPDEPAEGLAADLPLPAWITLFACGAAVSGVVFLQGVVGERLLQEGLIRGGIEATGLLLGVVLLGRRLGLLSSAR